MNESTVRLTLKQILVFVSGFLLLAVFALFYGKSLTECPTPTVQTITVIDSTYIKLYKADSAKLARSEQFTKEIEKTYRQSPKQVLKDIREWNRQNGN